MYLIALTKRLLRVSRNLICLREMVDLAHWVFSNPKESQFKVAVHGFEDKSFLRRGV